MMRYANRVNCFVVYDALVRNRKNRAYPPIPVFSKFRAFALASRVFR